MYIKDVFIMSVLHLFFLLNGRKADGWLVEARFYRDGSHQVQGQLGLCKVFCSKTILSIRRLCDVNENINHDTDV